VCSLDQDDWTLLEPKQSSKEALRKLEQEEKRRSKKAKGRISFAKSRAKAGNVM
jgi:hypothetical protein